MGLDGFKRLVGGAWPSLDVPGVQQPMPGGFRNDQCLCRSQALAGRVQGDGVVRRLQRLTVRQDDGVGILKVFPEQQESVGSYDRPAVPPGVVGVGVGYYALVPLSRRVKP